MEDHGTAEPGTREFFAARAADWDERFPGDGPAFAAAVERLGLRPGAAVLDAGCGTGRAFAPLRAAVGPGGRVVGVDVTPEMVRSARDRGRGELGLLVVADVALLPLGDGAVDGVLAAGLISHLPDPRAVLAELARVTVAGGRLALFHPVGRAVLAARRGRVLTAGDVRERANLEPLLRDAGWGLTGFHDGDDLYLAVAVRGS
ncbi:class I SAM-dependent methyltransferase [Sphaerisporangium aureirubrum]|uniref:Class I SAM-dependent methyltransferase n=1 Tax=Sphaerisporangium aureirubrum TaxID=1544736 RepID=A0ABW1NSF2_9ACTN